jgi:hypothetical protein
MSECHSVSDLVPLAALVNLQSLTIYGCRSVSDLAPLKAKTSLKSIDGHNPAVYLADVDSEGGDEDDGSSEDGAGV